MAYHHGNLREALLQRAAEVIAEDGVEAVSLRALARDLGVSHAAPARHFADRGALLAELAREGFERSKATMQAGADAAGDDPVDRYRALGRSYVQFALDQPSYFRAINHPEVQAHTGEELAEAKRAWFETVVEGARAAKASGWHPDTEIDTLVVFSCAAAIGAAMMLSDGSWRVLVDDQNPDSVADKMFDLVVPRVRTRNGVSRKSRGKSKRRRKASRA